MKLIISSDEKSGVTFEGSEGTLWANRGKHTVDPESLMNAVIGPDEIQLYKSDNHFRNFIDCVISREETIAPAEIGHRSITTGHLGNIAMKLGVDLEWDPENEQIVNNEEANKMLSRPMSEPWAGIYNNLVAEISEKEPKKSWWDIF
ncbi:MAG: hypothetical protein KAQ79_21770 [Cyclobacteriaceae bacterium]|nr:hypothetical protein [Cyclobacteriaceae bacterium]